MATCSDCGSNAAFFSVGDGKCSECDGSGEKHSLTDDFASMVGCLEPEDCDECDGTGECQTCDGTGEVDDDDDD